MQALARLDLRLIKQGVARMCDALTVRWCLLVMVTLSSVSAGQTYCLPGSPTCPCAGSSCMCTTDCLAGCDGGSCDLRCSFSSCTFQAGSDSRVRCEMAQTCNSFAGEELDLTCNQTASCTFDAGPQSSLRCTASTCAGQLGHGAFVDQRNGGDVDVVLGDDAGVLCTGSGNCVVAAGANSTITCGATSQCTVTVGPSSRVTCSISCDVTCLGVCNVSGAGCATTTCAPDMTLFTTGTTCGCRSLVPLDAGVDGGRPDGGAAVDGGADAGRDGGELDAGAATDAGGATDAGLDAGATVDAGSATDAGSPFDAGLTTDAGSATDAGSPVDAGLTTDAGAPDAGSTADAGPDAGAPADAGTTPDAGVETMASYNVGCGCTSAGPFALVLGLLALLKRRR